MAITALLRASAVAATVALLPTAASAESCFLRASRLARVDTDVLLAMSFVESRWHPDRINGSNSNGTEDVCLMQVNSAHYRRLASIGVTRDQLLSDWCVCLLTGAQVLGEMMNATGEDLWLAVAAYNAGPNNIQGGRPYAARVRQVLAAIQAVRSRQVPTSVARAAPAVAPVATSATPVGQASAGDARLDALAAQLRDQPKEVAHAP